MILGFDIGRTKTRLAVFESGDQTVEPVIFDTPAKVEAGRQIFIETAEKLLAGRSPEKIIGGKSRAVWPEADWQKMLADIWSVPVLMENDSALVGLGEAVFGAGRGYDIVAYITVSTGVGGARIVGGQIDSSIMGFEPGHQLVPGPDWVCPSGDGRGHLESLISGAAMEARTGQKPYKIEDPAVWDEQAKFLAMGLTNTIVHWSPAAVVVGGSMMKRPGIDLVFVEKYLNQFFFVVLWFFESVINKGRLVFWFTMRKLQKLFY